MWAWPRPLREAAGTPDGMRSEGSGARAEGDAPLPDRQGPPSSLVGPVSIASEEVDCGQGRAEGQEWRDWEEN